MKWLIMVLIMTICILLVICYALLVMARDADDRAERIYRMWRNSTDGRFDKKI